MTHEPTVDVHVAGIVRGPPSPKPTVVEAPGSRRAFQARDFTVSAPLESVWVAFHREIPVPLHGRVTDHPSMGRSPELVIVRSTLRPVPQSVTTLIPTVTSASVTGAAGVLGVEGVGSGVGVGVGVGSGAGAGVMVDDPTISHAAADVVHVVGFRDPPVGRAMNPKRADAPGARLRLHVGPPKR